jgi:hypothetical protein
MLAAEVSSHEGEKEPKVILDVVYNDKDKNRFKKESNLSQLSTSKMRNLV